MTTGDPPSKNSRDIAVRDHNRSKRMQAIRLLERLLKIIEAPDFKGHVSVEVHAAHGKIGGIKSRTEQFEPDD